MKLTAGVNSQSLGKIPRVFGLCLAGLVYVFVWVALWESSFPFWFMPAGLRFVALLYSKQRNWPVWIVADWLAIYCVNVLHTPSANPIEHGLANYLPPMIYTFSIGLIIKERSLEGDSDWLRVNLGSVLIAMSVAAIANAMVLHFLWPSINPMLAFEGFSVLGIANYTLGDVAGCLFALSLVELFRSALGKGNTEIAKLLKTQIMVVVPTLLLIAFLVVSEPNLEWVVLALLFVPIVYLSVKFGWIGAVFSIVLLNVSAGLLYLFIGSLDWLFHIQILLVSVGFTGLYLGSAITFQTELTNDLRGLSARVIDTQELERSRISRDLHDHVGQVLTALRSRVSILQHQSKSDFEKELEYLDKLAAEAYSDVQAIVGELSLKELEQFGLKRVLESSQLYEMLSDKNIGFRSSIDSAVAGVEAPIQLAIYRITQEALTNVANHSKASICNLKIDIFKQKGKNRILLSVEDNGLGFNSTNVTGGHGLRNMQDRVHALDGNITISSGIDGTSIQVTLPL